MTDTTTTSTREDLPGMVSHIPLVSYFCRTCEHTWQAFRVPQDKARCPRCKSYNLGVVNTGNNRPRPPRKHDNRRYL